MQQWLAQQQNSNVNSSFLASQQQQQQQQQQGLLLLQNLNARIADAYTMVTTGAPAAQAISEVAVAVSNALAIGTIPEHGKQQLFANLQQLHQTLAMQQSAQQQAASQQAAQQQAMQGYFAPQQPAHSQMYNHSMPSQVAPGLAPTPFQTQQHSMTAQLAPLRDTSASRDAILQPLSLNFVNETA